ncbi:hypothetical protein H2200_005065 [Cladophialophora chaetospira]|uniref:BTB domain-containing protein n=1 Tax=Cladophialophora chaetospira TaxID=386627 RepID=A0AA39CJJ1_9EURO|nr:hypothetical protein H2200_005065 [Cladophialophora chaetospira]
MAGTEDISSWSPPVVAFGTDFVIVLVGTEPQRFCVHKDLICACSNYFNSAYNGSFAETQSGVIKLPDLEPKLFNLFYQWLYSPARKVSEPLYQRPSDNELHPDELLLHLYRLADYLLVPGLQLLVIEQLKETFSSVEPTIPSDEFVSLLFADDQLRFMQTYVLKHMSFWISKCEDKDAWKELINNHSMVALGMATEFANLNPIHVDALEIIHPSKIADFEATVGLSLTGLQVEARKKDCEPAEISGGKVLGEFTVSQVETVLMYDFPPARGKVLRQFKYVTQGAEHCSVEVEVTTPMPRSSDRIRNRRRSS